MIYQGEHFTFGDEPAGEYSEIVERYGVQYGWASFDEHWYYEHTAFIPVPRNLDNFGIDTSFEDGTSLFKNGIIEYDTHRDTLIYTDQEEPAMGGRYYNATELGIEDYFDFDSETGVFVLVGD